MVPITAGSTERVFQSAEGKTVAKLHDLPTTFQAPLNTQLQRLSKGLRRQAKKNHNDSRKFLTRIVESLAVRSEYMFINP